MNLSDDKFKHVYCTNCIHWLDLYSSIKFNKSLPKECKICFPYDPENSKPLIKRKNYKEKI